MLYCYAELGVDFLHVKTHKSADNNSLVVCVPFSQ